MNILFLNSARSWGGNERWAASAAIALAERGHNVCFAYRDDIFLNRLSPKITTYILPFQHEFDVKTIQGLKKIVRRHHIHILLPTKRKEYWIAGRFGKKYRLGVVFRLGIVRRIKNADIIKRYVYGRLPDAIIVNAEGIRQGLLETPFVNPDKIVTIYNGYDFQPIVDTNLHLDVEWDPKRFVFVGAGRLTRRKGFDILLDAAQLLKEEGQLFSLYIAGEGARYNTLRDTIARYDLTRYVTLLGHVPTVRELFARAGAVVISSRNEGIPNTLMEAWSVSKPVIATNVAGLPEVVDDHVNGLLVPLNPDEFARAMKAVMDGPELANMLGANGYRTLVTEFTLDKMVTRMEQVFTRVMKKLNR
jgi:glycosyltransferase involved in cell wall biosynthesis